LTIGLEHRREGSENGDYQQLRPADPARNSHTLYFGQSQSTDSAYAEALVQLVSEEKSRAGLRAFDVQLAGRSERYTVTAGTPVAYLAPDGSVLSYSPQQGVRETIRYTSTNPTVGVKYKPLEWLAVRASYSGAFLPPTAAQFLPNAVSSCCQLILDPVSGQSYSVNFFQGGNPELKPQSSKNWNLGVIWEPTATALAGVRMNLEYYRITQPDYITMPAPQQVVSNPAYQDRVTRDPVTGRITAVDVSYLNALEYETAGWDLKVDYSRATRFGTFDVHALGTRIEHDRRQSTIGGPSLDYVGYPGEGGAAKTKANLTLIWGFQNWTLGTTTTYVGPYSQVYGSPGSPFALQYGPNETYTDAQGGFEIPSQLYHSVFGSYVFGDQAGSGSGAVRQVLSGLTLQFGINNVFDKAPPFDAYYAPYFYSPYGDARMRDFRVSVRKSF
jgi:outer membrane receptor protein involved in Fe transport